MIKFLCPNGHQLTAPDHLAGKTGKCPKCSTAFMVPTLEELAAAEGPEQPAPEEAPKAPSEADRLPPTRPAGEGASNGPVDEAAEKSATDKGESKSGVGKSAVGGSAVGTSDVGKSGVVGGSRIGTESTKGKGNVFVFLCPNGHKLNGPPSLKGKPGQCPHCGARFVIPEDDIPEEDIPTGAVEDESPPEEVPSGEPVEDEAPIDAHLEEEVVEAVVEEAEPDPEPIPPGVHALGYIVGRLWDHKTETTELEIFLQEGEIISPDQYSELLSTGEYGVFAHKDGDEYSLSVIPWAAVRRVDLRKVTKLGTGLFR
jgi:hypothetical protein